MPFVVGSGEEGSAPRQLCKNRVRYSVSHHPKKDPTNAMRPEEKSRQEVNDDGGVFPTDELISHQRALRRLAQGLRAAGLDEFADRILAELARLREAVIDRLVEKLGDDEPRTRDAATDILRDLLVKDPTLAELLLRRQEETDDPEIRDRIKRRILRADPALYRRHLEALIGDVGILFIALNFPPDPPPDPDDLQKVIDEIKLDTEQAINDAQAAAQDSSESGFREPFQRLQEREERRRGRKDFIDQLRRQIFGDPERLGPF